MKVKTLKPHANGYGGRFEKAKGAEYEIPDAHAAPLIFAGLVAELKHTAEKPGGRGGSGDEKGG